MKSDLFKLNLKDFGKGLLMFVAAAVLTFIYKSMQDCGGVECVAWADALDAGIMSAIAYLIKNFLTDGEDKFVGAV